MGTSAARWRDRFLDSVTKVVVAIDESRGKAHPSWVRELQIEVLSPVEASTKCDVLLLAVPFGVVAEVLAPLASALSGKVVVDCTNPVGPGLTHGLLSAQSGSEFVQSLIPSSLVVKAFSIYGFENFEGSVCRAVTPAMLYCGDDSEAKKKVGQIIGDLGWEPVNVGPLKQALHLEHMTLLWIQLVRVQGMSPHLVWAKVDSA